MMICNMCLDKVRSDVPVTYKQPFAKMTVKYIKDRLCLNCFNGILCSHVILTTHVSNTDLLSHTISIQLYQLQQNQDCIRIQQHLIDHNLMLTLE